MEKEIIINITDENPNASGRFNDNEKIISSIKVIDKLSEELLWQKLKNGIVLENYSLNKDKFVNYEEYDFDSDYNIVTRCLNEFFKVDQEIILTWVSNEKTLLTNSNTFIDNWEDFYSPSIDDLIVVNNKIDFVIYIAHYESFQFGQNIIIF